MNKKIYEENTTEWLLELTSVLNKYARFKEKKKKQKKTKDEAKLEKIDNILNLMKDLLINEIKSEIVPNVPDNELGKLIKYLKELQDELKVHLNILEKSEDINTKNYDNSQLELMRIFQMIQMQVVLLGKTLWLQRLSAVRRAEEDSIYIYIYI